MLVINGSWVSEETLGIDSWNSIGIVNVYGAFGIGTEYTSSDEMVTSLWRQRWKALVYLGIKLTND